MVIENNRRQTHASSELNPTGPHVGACDPTYCAAICRLGWRVTPHCYEGNAPQKEAAQVLPERGLNGQHLHSDPRQCFTILELLYVTDVTTPCENRSNPG